MSDELQKEIASLRSQLTAEKRRSARVLARHQQYALAMELVRQKNEELDALTSELNAARSVEAKRARDLELTNQKLQDQERENRELIARLQELVGQLSTPLLRVGRGVLALPIIGALNEERALTITTRLLDVVSSEATKYVVLDLTGLGTIETPTTEHLVRIARATRLLGARCILCGIQPAVANQMVTLGLDLGGIETVRDLHLALGLTRREDESGNSLRADSGHSSE